jgi:hypothetical protein
MEVNESDHGTTARGRSRCRLLLRDLVDETVVQSDTLSVRFTDSINCHLPLPKRRIICRVESLILRVRTAEGILT